MLTICSVNSFATVDLNTSTSFMRN